MSGLRNLEQWLTSSFGTAPIIVEYNEDDEMEGYTATPYAQVEATHQGEGTSSLVSLQPPKRTLCLNLVQGRTLRGSSEDRSHPLYTQPSSFPMAAKQSSNPAQDETMYTGPDRNAVAQAKDDSATESDSASDHPPSKKRKLVKDEPPHSPHNRPSHDSDASPLPQRGTTSRRVAGSDESDGDSPEPSTKQNIGSRSFGYSGRGGATRVKQPLKRGGRRL